MSISNQSLTRESPGHLDQQDSGTHTVTKGRPPRVKNKPDSWKNTAAPAWKPPTTLKLDVTLILLHTEQGYDPKMMPTDLVHDTRVGSK
jgi:hypothetical protein